VWTGNQDEDGSWGDRFPKSVSLLTENVLSGGNPLGEDLGLVGFGLQKIAGYRIQVMTG